MLTRLRRRFGNDDGFTLPELIVTIAIIAIIIVPLAQVVITFMLNSVKIGARQFESKDQQLAAQFWSSDVTSIGERNSSTFAASSGINNPPGSTCGSAPSGGSAQITFDWTTFVFSPATPTPVPATTRVTYYVTASTPTLAGTLVRTSCAAGGTPRSITVANTLETVSHAVQCSLNGTAWSSCSSLSGSGATGVWLKFYSADISGKGQGYWTVLSGQKRQTT